MSGPVEASATGFPIVGIGASAGGLAAFESFFSGMPVNTEPGMAFVLVQHLAPDQSKAVEAAGTSNVVNELTVAPSKSGAKHDKS